jgi:hypothetical protein
MGSTAMEAILGSNKRISKERSSELTTRLKHLILSVDGKIEKQDLRILPPEPIEHNFWEN